MLARRYFIMVLYNNIYAKRSVSIMKFLEKLSDFVGKYMAFIVVVVAAAAL